MIIVEYIDSIIIVSINIELNIVFKSFVIIDLFIDISQINSIMKHACFNKVIVYDFSKTVNFLTVLIDEYQNFFIDKNITMNISKKKMNVHQF